MTKPEEPIARALSVQSLKGILQRPARPVAVETMNDAIAARAASTGHAASEAMASGRDRLAELGSSGRPD